MADLFFFNDPATTEIYTLSLHDALPIWGITRRPTPSSTDWPSSGQRGDWPGCRWRSGRGRAAGDRKSTRLNSSHPVISYDVFCLKKKSSIYIHVKTPDGTVAN